ncbi:chemotaxis protein CheW [Telmatospirillum siberiense]|uniref:Chemotaxis protein CheW n=1 Tax=Telmatospirillum siberiense TaxID=382514 RepID=A0A2N3PQA7_9PROT|nr:chemotaxis protein CheW [Telmatospirillum siberiense]PKU22577.1 chemotaxis protein CheW [Telmatospirillum siberiense]
MTESSTLEDGAQYVTLGIDRDVFAVNVDKVREILDVRPVTRIPYAPSFMLGMIDVRGRSVPVIDLRTKLGLPAVEATEHTRIIVLDIETGERTLTMGILADRVFEVTSLDGKDIEAPPDVGIQWRSDYIQGIGRRADSFVIIFDLRNLFSSEEAALIIPASAPAPSHPEV